VGIVVAGMLLLNFIGDAGARREVVLGLAGYFLFFGPGWFTEIRERMETQERRRRFKGED
ncbi:MAG: hypothetical protein HC904_17820, partial [Blastochloris sp.]|nr:hypothetical protein [Blastochloris sp.]